MSQTVETRWFVLRVQVSKEERVKESLERRAKMRGQTELITRVEVPTETVSEIRGGKRKDRTVKLYPGYIMVECAVDPETGDIDEDVWFTVRETPGIGDFLGLNKPVPMQPHEVDRMLQRSVAPEDKPEVKIDFEIGQPVRIKEGPFESFEGVIEQIHTSTGKVEVSVTIFGRSTKVELEYWQVEKVA
jgi:transcriptional antiterminator NusG